MYPIATTYNMTPPRTDSSNPSISSTPDRHAHRGDEVSNTHTHKHTQIYKHTYTTHTPQNLKENKHITQTSPYQQE